MTDDGFRLLADTRELVALVERQNETFEHLRALAARQQDLVRQDEPEALLTILADRQRLVDDLTRVNKRLSAYRADWPRWWGALTADEQARVTSWSQRRDTLMAEILEADQRDVDALAGRQLQRRALIDRQVQHGRAQTAYRASARTASAPVTDAEA